MAVTRTLDNWEKYLTEVENSESQPSPKEDDLKAIIEFFHKESMDKPAQVSVGMFELNKAAPHYPKGMLQLSILTRAMEDLELVAMVKKEEKRKAVLALVAPTPAAPPPVSRDQHQPATRQAWR